MKRFNARTKNRWQELDRRETGFRILPEFCLMQHLRLYQCPLPLQPRRCHFEQLPQTNSPFVLNLCHSLLYQSPYRQFHWRRKNSCRPTKRQEDILRLVIEIWFYCPHYVPILEPPLSSVTTRQLWPLPDLFPNYCVCLQKMTYWQIKGNTKGFLPVHSGKTMCS